MVFVLAMSDKFSELGLNMWKPIYSRLLMNFTGVHWTQHEGMHDTGGKRDKVSGTRH